MTYEWPMIQVLNQAFQMLQRGKEGTIPFKDDVGKEYIAIVDQEVLFVRRADLKKQPLHDMSPEQKWGKR